MSTSNGANSAFVAAIDQGTSSSRVILYNAAGESIATHQVPLELLTPSPGWVEQRPQDIIDTVKTCMQGVLENAKEAGFTVSSENLKAVGITNQRETTVVWNKKTGKPLYNTIGTCLGRNKFGPNLIRLKVLITKLLLTVSPTTRCKLVFTI